jgi:hypothetical protein
MTGAQGHATGKILAGVQFIIEPTGLFYTADFAGSHFF